MYNKLNNYDCFKTVESTVATFVETNLCPREILSSFILRH